VPNWYSSKGSVTIAQAKVDADYVGMTEGFQRLMKDLMEGAKDRAMAPGGIDFDPGMLNLKVERTGDKVKVTVDPAELQRIQTEGVDGFMPVIINIVPVKAMLPALGLSEAPGAEQTAGATS
jgi:hypothetical protein